ncbi:hypothetical protein LFL96_34840 (plasmid) [Paraburkholderia sp. D15]|uniref:hypothetical protein n=1 Tax=Paraburkholderia sp. D15 TaxID=2880218 RepID=UPI00247A6F64|nr:hypothetical protein [Paraburkholderia sp. D15]WGS55299.1 hypothetical protein LFL96_34840 [Paraburkholderia sp. D15]
MATGYQHWNDHRNFPDGLPDSAKSEHDGLTILHGERRGHSPSRCSTSESIAKQVDKDLPQSHLVPNDPHIRLDRAFQLDVALVGEEAHLNNSRSQATIERSRPLSRSDSIWAKALLNPLASTDSDRPHYSMLPD